MRPISRRSRRQFGASLAPLVDVGDIFSCVMSRIITGRRALQSTIATMAREVRPARLVREARLSRRRRGGMTFLGSGGIAGSYGGPLHMNAGLSGSASLLVSFLFTTDRFEASRPLGQCAPAQFDVGRIFSGAVTVHPCAIAEADLGAHVDLNPCPAVGRRAYERPPKAPLIERERPLRFSPNRLEDGLVRGCSRVRQRQRRGNSSGSDDHEHECKRPANSPTHPGSGQRVALFAGCEPGGAYTNSQ
jgi:hypothetical protein